MSEEQNELIKRFTDILETLPSDKKQLLYNRLKNAEPDERNMIMMTVVNRFNAAHAQAPARSEEDVFRMAAQSAPNRPQQQAPVRQQPVAPVMQNEPAPQDQPVHQTQPAPLQRTAPRGPAAAPQYEPDTDAFSPEDFGRSQSESNREQRQPKKKLKKEYKTMFVGIIAALLVVAVGIAVFLNKDKLFAGSGSVETSAQAADDSAQVSDNTDAAVDTSSVETTEEATPTPSPEPTPTPVPLSQDAPDLTGLVICIDPGHQETTDPTTEPAAEWLSTEKARCTCGTVGIVTGTTEYELTLNYGLFIKSYLEECGATVIMTRETNDVNISNIERAQIAINNSADVFIRLHADAANNSSATGVKVYVADSGDYASQLNGWGSSLAEMVATAEGFQNNGVMATYLYTGLNYANSIPSFQICLGYLSNSDDEAVLIDESNYQGVAQAIALFCENFL